MKRAGGLKMNVTDKNVWCFIVNSWHSMSMRLTSLMAHFFDGGSFLCCCLLLSPVVLLLFVTACTCAWYCPYDSLR